jgi:hypothetical protein
MSVARSCFAVPREPLVSGDYLKSKATTYACPKRRCLGRKIKRSTLNPHELYAGLVSSSQLLGVSVLEPTSVYHKTASEPFYNTRTIDPQGQLFCQQNVGCLGQNCYVRYLQ